LEPVSLYFHIPFCSHRCAYCDFNTYAGQEGSIPAYVEALCREIRLVAESAPGRLVVHTVFFGGGTPSLLSATQFDAIFRTIREHYDLVDKAEISLEANPGTLSFAYLLDLFSLGFNRLSLGVQSAQPDELRMLERIHDYFEVIQSVEWSRRAGFENLNLDLIFGLPEQSLDRWQATVNLILGLRPEHLSLYALTLEHGTPFGRWARHGLLPMPDPDAAADMYEWAEEALASAGYEHYEISNWAQSGQECQHNLQYWRNLPYLGFGAGAHGFANNLRYSNALRIKTYIDRLTPPIRHLSFPLSPSTVNHQRITVRTEMQETMITGLRLTQEGVSAAAFRERFGRGLVDVFGKEIDELIGLGLLEWVEDSALHLGKGLGERVRLTVRGRLLGNQVFVRFVD
jgi:oxygen-independent coproporphyrinogen-3 oxidase